MENVIASPVLPPMNAQGQTRTTPFGVNVNAGSTNSRLSSQWSMRPDDQRYVSLTDLHAATLKSASESFFEVINTRDVEVKARSDDPNDLRLIVPRAGRDPVVTSPNHWSFGQLCTLVQTPASYLRKLPAQLAGINLQYGLAAFREEAVKAYVRDNGKTELRAATGPDYGRIFDHEVVSAVMRVAGNGVSDTCWKVPGMLNWGNLMYDPLHPISKSTTTLYASDRDVFGFLVDDTHPIEIGTIRSGPHAGQPDLVFRGFMFWNSEVGSKTLGVATMYLRAICCNRILWGVEGYSEITLRHSKNAPMRLDAEIRPALESYANASTGNLLSGIKAARDAVVARSDDDRLKFLDGQGFTKAQSKAIVAAVLDEEGKAAESIWDFVQGITAVARGVGHQDERVDMERKAGKILDKVAA